MRRGHHRPLPHQGGPANEEVDAQASDLARPQQRAHVRPLAELRARARDVIGGGHDAHAHAGRVARAAGKVTGLEERAKTMKNTYKSM